MEEPLKLAPSNLPCPLCLTCSSFSALPVSSVDLITFKKFVLLWDPLPGKWISNIFLNKALSSVWSMSSFERGVVWRDEEAKVTFLANKITDQQDSLSEGQLSFPSRCLHAHATLRTLWTAPVLARALAHKNKMSGIYNIHRRYHIS